MSKFITDNGGALNLATAILDQAREDYIDTILLTDYDEEGEPRKLESGWRWLEDERASLERFYKSDEFRLMSMGKCDGDAAIRSIRLQAIERYNYLKKIAHDKTKEGRQARAYLKRTKPFNEIYKYCTQTTI